MINYFPYQLQQSFNPNLASPAVPSIGQATSQPGFQPGHIAAPADYHSAAQNLQTPGSAAGMQPFHPTPGAPPPAAPAAGGGQQDPMQGLSQGLGQFAKGIQQLRQGQQPGQVTPGPLGTPGQTFQPGQGGMPPLPPQRPLGLLDNAPGDGTGDGTQPPIPQASNDPNLNNNDPDMLKRMFGGGGLL